MSGLAFAVLALALAAAFFVIVFLVAQGIAAGA